MFSPHSLTPASYPCQEPTKAEAYLLYHTWPNNKYYFPMINFFLELAGEPMIPEHTQNSTISADRYMAMHRQIKKYYKEKYGEEL